VRVLLWVVISVLVTFTVFAIPLVLGGVAFDLTYVPPGDWRSDLAAAVTLGSLVGAVFTHFLLLVPSGCAVFLDHAIRNKRVPLGRALREAWTRFVTNAPRLFVVLLVVSLLYLPWLVLVGGAAFFSYVALAATQQALAVAALIVLVGLPLGFFPLLVTLGLAVPVVILEERSATSALARSWELVRPHLVAFGLLVLGNFALVALLGALLGWLSDLLGAQLLVGIVSPLIDIMLWPALLVAAYHGLMAENAGILGRR
jgi:hypothetical protein